MNFGVIQSFIIAIFININLAHKKKILWIKENNLLPNICLIFLNMLVFLKFPFEPMYLQISVISTYYLLSIGFRFNQLNILFIICILSMNIFGWYKTIDILNISYENNNLCSPIKAIAAKPSLFLKDGKYNWLIKNNKKVNCHYKSFENINSINYSEKILKGNSLR